MAKRTPTTITNKVLLEHMQAGHEALRTELKRETSSLRTELIREIRRLDAKIETLRKDVGGLKGDVEELKENDRKTHTALQRLYERRLEMVEQLENRQPSPSSFNGRSGLRPASEKHLVRLERAGV